MAASGRYRLGASILVAVYLAVIPADAGAAPADNPADAWLALMAKADRPKAAAKWANLDVLSAALAADRGRAVEAERSYSIAAGVLAAALDAHGASPAALGLALELAGRTELGRGEAVISLAEKRRLRWETARDIAEGGYGHAAAAGFLAARDQDAAILNAGGELRSLLAGRVAGQTPAMLAPLAAALADRLSRHPNYPTAAFTALRLAAADLPAAAYRTWLLALTEATPEFVAALTPLDVAEPAAVAYNAALAGYVTTLAARRSLAVAWPAAAAAAWYVDTKRRLPAAGLARDAEYIGPTDTALAGMGAFAEVLAESDPTAIVAYIAEDSGFAVAYGEAASLFWLASTCGDENFVSGIRTTPEIVRRALGTIWTVGRRCAPASEAPRADLDFPALVQAEELSVAWAAINDDYDLVAAARSAAVGYPALAFALERGVRYAALRDRIDAAQRGFLAAAALELSHSVRTTAAYQSAEAALTASGRAVAPQLELPLRRNGFLAVPWLGIRLSVPIDPEHPVEAAFEPRLFAAVAGEPGAPRLLPAFLLKGGQPSAGELAILHSPAFPNADFASAAETWLAPLAARIGVPRTIGTADRRSRSIFAFASTVCRYAAAVDRL